MTILQILIIIGLSGLLQSCCPDGWRKGKNSCYFISPRTVSWAEASSICQSFHSELAVINDAEENVLIGKIITNIRGALATNLWIDGSDRMIEGEWYWASTMERFGYKNWAINEPNDQKELEDCLEMYVIGFYWNDNKCDILNHFICEKEYVSFNFSG
ncbi:perlucin-like [Saccostrea echinata]|uniref:perlucin-like n=1 Tax=Saccostrea echinata TaxID=191078 RepID=UPI002A80B03B|nr:perlucin-like [Saccostrea echinata]